MWAFLKGKTFFDCHKRCQGTSGEVNTRKLFTQTFQMKMCTSAHTTKKSIHKTTSPQWKKGLANTTKENYKKIGIMPCIFSTHLINYGTKLFTIFKDEIYEREM